MTNKPFEQWLKTKQAKFVQDLDLVKKACPLFYKNTYNGMIVLVRADDYRQACEEYQAAIRTGLKRPWETIVIVVKPAFVFCENPRNQNFLQIGNSHDAATIVGQAEKIVAGELTATVRKSAVLRDWCSGDDINLPVCKDAPLLFVPFASTKLISGEEQAKMFQRYPLTAVTDYLLHKVPLPKSE